MELKTVTNDLLDKLARSIEENNGPKGFRSIIQLFIRFWDDNSYRCLEMRRPMT